MSAEENPENAGDASFLEDDWRLPFPEVRAVEIKYGKRQLNLPWPFRKWVTVCCILTIVVASAAMALGSVLFDASVPTNSGDSLSPTGLAVVCGCILVWSVVFSAASLARSAREVIVDPNNMARYHPSLFVIYATLLWMLCGLLFYIQRVIS